mgnify:CR=1 FL=1
MGGYGNRNMYRMTGLPGWMRFGYSPGWQGRSASGLGPAAEYLTSGRWPTPQLEQAWPAGPGFAPAPDHELDSLKRQADMLNQQLEHISKRIDELEKD